MARFELHLTPFFTREAKTFISVYKRLIANRQGIDLDAAPNNAASTIARKKKNHWMVDTGKLKANGFKSQIREKGFAIYASKENHPGKQKTPVTYEDLFTWHNQKGYSGVFGNRLPKGSRFYERLVKEVDFQLRPQIARAFTKRIKIKI